MRALAFTEHEFWNSGEYFVTCWSITHSGYFAPTQMFRSDERMEWSIEKMLANRRRSTSEVLKEILLSSPATKTNIRYSVGLNLNQAKRYLPHLIDEWYLRLTEDERGSAIYEINSKGKKLLQILSDLSEMTDLEDELPYRARVPAEPVAAEG